MIVLTEIQRAALRPFLRCVEDRDGRVAILPREVKSLTDADLLRLHEVFGHEVATLSHAAIPPAE